MNCVRQLAASDFSPGALDRKLTAKSLLKHCEVRIFFFYPDVLSINFRKGWRAFFLLGRFEGSAISDG